MPEPREGAGPAAIRPSTMTRVAVIASWAVIAAVVLRIASGGGSLVGVRFVLETEPFFLLLVGSGLLAAAGIVMVGMTRRSAWAERVADVLTALAIPAFLLLLAEGHDSAVFGLVAAGTALSVPRLGRVWSGL